MGSDISKMSNQRKEISSPVASKEEKSVGAVKGGLYISYFKSGGNCCTVIVILLVNLLCQVDKIFF